MDRLISSQIRKEELMAIFEKNYSRVGPLWSNHQLEWINGIYQAYKNHDKYLITIYLIKKNFNSLSKNFIIQTYAEYFERDSIELDVFNVMEVSKALNIPKESARRKINELEKKGSIKRVNKRIIIDKSTFLLMKPRNSIVGISRFLSNLSSILYNEKSLPKEYDSSTIKIFIEKNFSFIWKLYYEVQIPMLLNWKFFFKDIETFHIWGACVVNQKLNSQRKDNPKMNKKKYMEKYFYNNIETTAGINAMSISDITGIPRATVIRKLNTLIKKKNLKIDDKKLYTVTGDHRTKITSIQKKNLDHLAEFTSRVFNLIILTENKKLKKKNEELPQELGKI